MQNYNGSSWFCKTHFECESKHIQQLVSLALSNSKPTIWCIVRNFILFLHKRLFVGLEQVTFQSHNSLSLVVSYILDKMACKGVTIMRVIPIMVTQLSLTIMCKHWKTSWFLNEKINNKLGDLNLTQRKMKITLFSSQILFFFNCHWSNDS